MRAGMIWGALTDPGYRIMISKATYAPHTKDRLFLMHHDTVEDFTLIDVKRLYQLWELVEQVRHLEGDIIEVGVWQGGSAALIAKRTNIEGINCTVYLCDTFEGCVKASSKDPHYKGGEHGDTDLEIVDEVLDKMGVKNTQILIGTFPDGTGTFVSKNKFRLSHIDVDTHDSARDCFEFLFPRTVVGGVLVFDDYGFYSCSGVTDYVNSIKDREDLIFMYNLSGQGVVVRIK